LGLPLTSEQNMNAGIVKQKKIGTILNYKVVDEEALENAIKKLMNNKKVHANVDGMSSLVKDSRTDPLEVSAELKDYL
jgi:UDP:flavonoid glycosyltransferase YjiC (YdhE family)